MVERGQVACERILIIIRKLKEKREVGGTYICTCPDWQNADKVPSLARQPTF